MTIIELDDREIMRLEAILLDKDKDEALLFLREVIKAKLRSKGSSALDRHKSTGIMT